MCFRYLLLLAFAGLSVCKGQPGPRALGHFMAAGAGYTTPRWIKAYTDADTTTEAYMLSALCNGRSQKQRVFASIGGHFLIHYDTSGSNAVSPVDFDKNLVPDYIDSVGIALDSAWHVEVDSLGFQPPPPDTLNPGEGDEDGRIDVYICDLPVEFYGGVQPEISNPVGIDRVSGYMVLDNDYAAPTYSIRGVPEMEVTAAHSLGELIGFASYRYVPEQLALYEATATWFEQQVFPDIPDYRQYVREFLKAPQNYPLSTQDISDGVTGYAHMLYISYLANTYGRDIIRDIWEDFRTEPSFAAIDALLRRHGSDLENSYCEFAAECYHTGYRAAGSHALPNASSYPAMYADTTMVAPAAFGGALKPLAFILQRVLVPNPALGVTDTLDFVTTNARSDLNGGDPFIPAESYTIQIGSVPGDGFQEVGVRNQTMYYRLESSGGAFCTSASVSIGMPSSGVNEEEARSANSITRFQCIPNPASTSATITFTLAQRGRGALRIVDVRGNEVALLLDAMLEPGSYTIPVATSSLAAGLYWCRLEVGGRRMDREVVVVR